jgi:hypothetical protein
MLYPVKAVAGSLAGVKYRSFIPALRRSDGDEGVLGSRPDRRT